MGLVILFAGSESRTNDFSGSVVKIMGAASMTLPEADIQTFVSEEPIYTVETSILNTIPLICEFSALVQVLGKCKIIFLFILFTLF